MSETRTRRKPAAGKTVSKRKVATAAPKKRAPRAKVVEVEELFDFEEEPEAPKPRRAYVRKAAPRKAAEEKPVAPKTTTRKKTASAKAESKVAPKVTRRTKA
ncbi:hypothetical protein NBRC3299_2136 [Acetobacter pasteurianus NBRC 3299]|nr:hypothetical protein NBRC3299_2136 [Acetobacter pasteurianus NBRC 3299]